MGGLLQRADRRGRARRVVSPAQVAHVAALQQPHAPRADRGGRPRRLRRRLGRGRPLAPAAEGAAALARHDVPRRGRFSPGAPGDLRRELARSLGRGAVGRGLLPRPARGRGRGDERLRRQQLARLGRLDARADTLPDAFGRGARERADYDALLPARPQRAPRDGARARARRPDRDRHARRPQRPPADAHFEPQALRRPAQGRRARLRVPAGHDSREDDGGGRRVVGRRHVELRQPLVRPERRGERRRPRPPARGARRRGLRARPRGEPRDELRGVARSPALGARLRAARPPARTPAVRLSRRRRGVDERC